LHLELSDTRVDDIRSIKILSRQEDLRERLTQLNLTLALLTREGADVQDSQDAVTPKPRKPFTLIHTLSARNSNP